MQQSAIPKQTEETDTTAPQDQEQSKTVVPELAPQKPKEVENPTEQAEAPILENIAAAIIDKLKSVYNQSESETLLAEKDQWISNLGFKQEGENIVIQEEIQDPQNPSSLEIVKIQGNSLTFPSSGEDGKLSDKQAKVLIAYMDCMKKNNSGKEIIFNLNNFTDEDIKVLKENLNTYPGNQDLLKGITIKKDGKEDITKDIIPKQESQQIPSSPRHPSP